MQIEMLLRSLCLICVAAADSLRGGVWDVNASIKQLKQKRHDTAVEQMLRDISGSPNNNVCDNPDQLYTEECLREACDDITNSLRCMQRVRENIALERKAKDCSSARDSTVAFHSFWAGSMKRSAMLSLWSFVRTQSCGQMWVWHEDSLETLNSDGGGALLAPLLKAARGKVVLKKFEAPKLARGTIFEPYVKKHIVEPKTNHAKYQVISLLIEVLYTR
jgi:hypothetical protein